MLASTCKHSVCIVVHILGCPIIKVVTILWRCIAGRCVGQLWHCIVHGPTDAATMTKSFAIQEEDEGSKRRMENLPTDNRLGITNCNQSGSGQIMRITSCNASGSGTNNGLDAVFRGRRDKQEEGMTISSLWVSIWIWKRQKEKQKIFQRNKKEKEWSVQN